MIKMNNKFLTFLLLFPCLYSGLRYQLIAKGSFDSQKAYKYLLMQTDLGPRNPGSKGHATCLKLLKNELSKFGAKVLVQPFLYYDPEIGKTITMSNIIGSFKPEKNSRIILCAHWDTRPMADRDKPGNREKPIIGANDGASGVAVLLELARQISIYPPSIGVDIIFFDGEDYGKEGQLNHYCLGSRHFMNNNTSFYPKYAILLDMIGDSQLEIPQEGYSLQYAPKLMDMIWNIAAELGLSQFVPEPRHYVFDDHVILNEGGIPAVDLIDFEYPDEKHSYWHTLEDTPDKCSPESLKAVGDVLMEIIYRQSE